MYVLQNGTWLHAFRSADQEVLIIQFFGSHSDIGYIVFKICAMITLSYLKITLIVLLTTPVYTPHKISEG